MNSISLYSNEQFRRLGLSLPRSNRESIETEIHNIIRQTFGANTEITIQHFVAAIPHEDLSVEMLKVAALALHIIGKLREPTLPALRNLSLHLRNYSLASALSQSDGEMDEIERVCSEDNVLSPPLHEKVRTPLLSIRLSMAAYREDEAIQIFDFSRLTANEMYLLIHWAAKRKFDRLLEKIARDSTKQDDLAHLKLLKDYQFDFSQELSIGGTLLHIAAKNCAYEALDWLLSHGVDPNRVDRLGRTALHRAFEINHEPPNLDRLIESTNLSIRDYRGITPPAAALLRGKKNHYTKLMCQRVHFFERDIDGTPYFCYLSKGALRNHLIQMNPSLRALPPKNEIRKRARDVEKVPAHINALGDWGNRDYEKILPLDFLSDLELAYRSTFFSLDQRIITAIRNGIEYFNTEESESLSVLIAQGELAFIPVQSKTHVIYIVVGAGLIALSDRARIRTFRAYEITLNKTPAQIKLFLDRLILLIQEEDSELVHFCDQVLPAYFGCQSTESTRTLESISPSRQRVRNCVSANFMGATRAALFLIELIDGRAPHDASVIAKEESKKISTKLRIESLRESLRENPVDYEKVFAIIAKLQTRQLALEYAKMSDPILDRLLGCRSYEEMRTVINERL